MKFNKIWLYLLLLGAALAPVPFFMYNYSIQRATSPYPTIEFVSQKPKEMVVGSEISITSCQIVDGSIFFVFLENQEVIEARLKLATKDEATIAVIEMLKTAVSPSVVLRRKVGSYWIVDINLTTGGIGGKRTTLVEWLEDKKLTL